MATWAEMFEGVSPTDYVFPHPDAISERMDRVGFVQILGHVHLGEAVPDELIERMTQRDVVHHYPEKLEEIIQRHNCNVAELAIIPSYLKQTTLEAVANRIVSGVKREPRWGERDDLIAAFNLKMSLHISQLNENSI